MQEWISLKDELPDRIKHRVVLYLRPSEHPDDSIVSCYTHHPLPGATHWQPLPAKPDGYDEEYARNNKSSD